MGNPKEFFKKYGMPQGAFEWIFFSALLIVALGVIIFLMNMYAQTQ